MNIDIIEQLRNIIKTVALTEEQKKIIEKTIIILEKKQTKEALIDAAKILASLFTAASHFIKL
jgi:hypothetical protein